VVENNAERGRNRTNNLLMKRLSAATSLWKAVRTYQFLKKQKLKSHPIPLSIPPKRLGRRTGRARSAGPGLRKNENVADALIVSLAVIMSDELPNGGSRSVLSE